MEQLELDDAAAESSARPGTRSARRVHLAVLPERYEPLEEPAPAGPADKPKRRYRQKLKKYGKVGPAHCPRSGCGVRGAPWASHWGTDSRPRRVLALSLLRSPVPFGSPHPPSLQHSQLTSPQTVPL